MELDKVYNVIIEISNKDVKKYDYYECFIFNEITTNNCIRHIQKLVLYITWKNMSYEIVASFGSEKEIEEIWKYTISKLIDKKGQLSYRNNNSELESLFSNVANEEERYRDAKYINGLYKSIVSECKNVITSFDSISRVRMYMNSVGVVSQEIDSTFITQNVNELVCKESFYTSFDLMIQDIRAKSQINTPDMNIIKKCSAEQIILSPEVVNRMLVVPLNQMLNNLNESSRRRTYNIPSFITLDDYPLHNDNIMNKRFDMVGKRIKNHQFIKNGIIKKRYDIDESSNNTYDGYANIYKNEIKLCLHKPFLKEGETELNEMRGIREIIEARKFIGSIDIVNNKIIGKFVDSYIWSFGKCIGIIKEISITLTFQLLLDSLVAVSKEKEYIRNILFSNCPYMLMNRKV